MKYSNIPKPLEVAQKLRELGGTATAVELCRLLSKDYFKHEAQIGIQEATDAGLIVVNKDWSLSVKFDPDDKGLGEPKKKFEDTFSVWTVIMNHFFPERT